MRHLRPLNKKAARIDGYLNLKTEDVTALQNPPGGNQQQRPHVPMGCALMFTPGWEVDAAGGTAGLCMPVERDIYDCYVSCYEGVKKPESLSDPTNSRSSSPYTE